MEDFFSEQMLQEATFPKHLGSDSYLGQYMGTTVDSTGL